MNKKSLTISATTLIVSITIAVIYFVNKPSRPKTIGEVCRAYALAIEEVAKARDNLDEPSWEELVKQNPVLEKNGENDRAVAFAQSISLRLVGTDNSPSALKKMVFEQCHETFLCLHRGVCE